MSMKFLNTAGIPSSWKAVFSGKRDQEQAEEIELREQDHELQRLQNILDSYVQEQNLLANYETFIRFGTPYVKILDMQKAHKPGMMIMAAPFPHRHRQDVDVQQHRLPGAPCQLPDVDLQG